MSNKKYALNIAGCQIVFKSREIVPLNNVSKCLIQTFVLTISRILSDWLHIHVRMNITHCPRTVHMYVGYL